MTIRRTPTESEIEPCLDFTPVPRVYNRYDGWTPDRQRAFIAALARLGTVKAAAAEIGMAAVGAYALRRQKGAEEFARAWARAHAAGVACLRDIAYDRAVNGTPRGIWHKGERVGEERKYDNRLLAFMLRREAPAGEGKPKLLSSGTKHPATIEREARWASEAAGQPALPAPGGDDDDPFREPPEPERPREYWKPGHPTREIIDMYAERAVEMRRARLAGDLAGADFMLRQLTMFEVGIRLGGRGGWSFGERLFKVLNHGLPDELPRAPSYPPEGIGGPGPDGEPLSGSALIGKIFANAHAYAFAKVDPPRVDPGFWWPSHLTVQPDPGPTFASREAAREMAKKQFAQALALYEATESEEAWASYAPAEPALP